MLRPWVLGVAAAVCAVVAVAIPRGPWADDIHVVEQVDMSNGITVQIDDRRVVVHPPEGYSIQGWGEGSEPSVQLTMMGDDGMVSVRIGPGREAGVFRRGAVSREIVHGATMTVFSRRLPEATVERMFDELEIS